MTDLQYLRSIALDCLAAKHTQKPSDWCAENLIFDEANNHGPFTLNGCEYIKEILDDFADNSITDETLVMGSQTRKTGSLMGGAAWKIKNSPSGFLWVMPNFALIGKFNRQRLMKMFRASPAIANLIPTGAQRHDFSTASMMLGASTLNFVGANSASNVKSTPAQTVLQDEVDAFEPNRERDTHPCINADERTKDQSNPQRWKTSTPTLVQGMVWQEFLKGDQRRYFIPCPGCAKEVVLAWSREFTMLPKTGDEAYIEWDKAAKVNGEWDLDRVKKSAHAVCPHCKRKIPDSEKPAMVKAGRWKATNPHAPSTHVSRHLPSLYANSEQTSFGSLAVKFLQAKKSLMGLQGFINGELAEPYEAQDKRGKRIELVTIQSAIAAEGWAKQLTVDCQANSPHFWYVARAWSQGKTEGIESGSCETWEEVREVQLRLGIPDVGVCVDSGWGARSDAEVYRTCVGFGQLEERAAMLPLAIGWMPSKGMPGRKRFKDKETGLELPYHLSPLDPFLGTSEAGQVEISLLEFSADFYKDILATMRDGKKAFKWSISKQMDNEEYWRHMDGEQKQAQFNNRTGKTTFTWVRLGKYWPNHLLDAETMQIALASFYGLVNVVEQE